MDKIKRFSEFCEERDSDKGLADIDAMPNEDEMLTKLSQFAISRHRERFIDFFTSLAKNDDDIKRTLGEYRDKRSNFLPNDLRKGSEGEEKDIVAPSTADMSGPL